MERPGKFWALTVRELALKMEGHRRVCKPPIKELWRIQAHLAAQLDKVTPPSLGGLSLTKVRSDVGRKEGRPGQNSK